MIFFNTLGRMPHTGWITLIGLVAGFAEALGISLFVPLMTFLSEGQEITDNRLIGVASEVFHFLGIPWNVEAMAVSMGLLIVGGFVLVYLQRILVFYEAANCAKFLRNTITQNLLLSSWPHLSKQAGGEVVNNLVVETNRSSHGLMAQLQMITAMIHVLVLGMFSTFISLKLVLLVGAFSVLLGAVALPIVRRADGLGRANSKANKDYGFVTVDYMKGTRLIKASGMEDRVISLINDYSEKVFLARFAMDLNSATLFFILQSIPVVIIMGVIIAARKWLDVEIVELLAFLFVLVRIAPRINEIPQRYEIYRSCMASLNTVDEMVNSSFTHREKRLNQGRPFKHLEHGIKLNNVSFAFSGTTDKALHNLTFEIPKNSMVAIVGSSGSGKSTLMNLLTSLYDPTSGEIVVDSQDLAEVDLLSWRRRISFVSQDVTMFNDTLAHNITLTCPDCPAEKVQEVLRLANLDSFIDSLPNGLDTMIGEDGVRLSGGQKQRLALARALLSEPDILLLDEATSALDNESEKAVQEAIEAISHKLTIVVVAHRLSTVRNADTIHVLEDGQIVESGSYESLLAKGGRFKNLHDIQFS